MTAVNIRSEHAGDVDAIDGVNRAAFETATEANLVRAGLDECRRLGSAAVVLVGHAAFYPRFGFVPASRFRLGCQYDLPDDVFMAVELEAGALRGKAGIIRYHDAFAEVEG
jgi:putative acetyltransferase